MLQTLIHHPTAYLHEVQDHLFQATGVWVSASTVCRTISEHGFTHNKVEVIALQRRIEYMAEISLFNPDMLIWIDETGSDKRKYEKVWILTKGNPTTHMPTVCRG